MTKPRPVRGMPTPAREILPVLALVALSVLVPAVLALWFMQRALANERLVAERRIAEMADTQLGAVADYLHEALRERALVIGDETDDAPMRFRRAVLEGNAEGAVFFNGDGGVAYPSDALRGPMVARPSALDASAHSELLREIAGDSEQPPVARAEALQQLLRLGETDIGDLIDDQVLRAVDEDGRAPGAMALMGLLQRTPIREGITWSRFADVASDYSLPIRAGHRRFLLQTARDAGALNTGMLNDVGTRLLAAEEFSASLTAFASARREPSAIHPTPNGDAWILMSPDASSAILMKEETMLRLVAREAARVPGLLGAVELRTAEHEGESLAAMPAGASFPAGSRLRIIANEETPSSVGDMALPLTIGLGLLAFTVVATAGALRMTYSRLNLARLRSDLATTVSHELKTPVASTRVLVDTLLESDLADSAQTREYLELIARENFRLSRLIENFLLFSRIERGRLALRRELSDPAELARRAVNVLQERAIAGAREVACNPGSDLPPVDVDREAFASILQNLLENAVKHTNDGKGRIALDVRAENNQVRFTVADNGEGIPPDQLARIFEAFHRVDSRLSRSTEGAGLGLSIVHSLVEAHGGRVAVESNPGRGSTFAIILPIAEQPIAGRAG